MLTSSVPYVHTSDPQSGATDVKWYRRVALGEAGITTVCRTVSFEPKNSAHHEPELGPHGDVGLDIVLAMTDPGKADQNGFGLPSSNDPSSITSTCASAGAGPPRATTLATRSTATQRMGPSDNLS
jgi:hypothetical protein